MASNAESDASRGMHEGESKQLDDEQFARSLASAFREEELRRKIEDNKASMELIRKLTAAEKARPNRLSLPEDVDIKAANQTFKSGHWQQQSLQKNNEYPREWTCQRCTLQNSAPSKQCAACGYAPSIPPPVSSEGSVEGGGGAGGRKRSRDNAGYNANSPFAQDRENTFTITANQPIARPLKGYSIPPFPQTLQEQYEQLKREVQF
eukprot:jgi/Bigna1/81810/fgenesh1_pg.84_\